MKFIFALCFFLQGSSWKVAKVEKESKHFYHVEVYKKDSLNGVSGTLYRAYTTDMIKSPEKLQ